MAANFEDFPPEVQERIKSQNPHLFPTPAAPTGPGPAPVGGQPRRRNPLIAPHLPGAPATPRLPGGAAPGAGRQAVFSAGDEAPESAPRPQSPYTDVAAQANEFKTAESLRAAYKQRAQGAGRGSATPPPEPPLHPTLFGRMRQGMQNLGQNIDRHGLAMAGANANAISHLHKGGSVGDLLNFAAGYHLEPVYRRMEREEHVADMDKRLGIQRTPLGTPMNQPRPRGRARPVSLHFD
jgi:hypothetical protein